jgi:hypothetical protein
LAIDAGVDVNSAVIAKRLETAQAFIADLAMSQHPPAFAVQAWSPRSHQKHPLEQCMAID